MILIAINRIGVINLKLVEFQMSIFPLSQPFTMFSEGRTTTDQTKPPPQFEPRTVIFSDEF